MVFCKYSDPNCTGSHSTGQAANKICPSALERKRIREAATQNRKRRRRDAEFKQMLGGKCVNCGATEDLEFDHIVPETKEFSIWDSLTDSKNRLMAELTKCQLLCELCHQAKTAQEAGQSATAKQDQLEALINQYERTA